MLRRKDLMIDAPRTARRVRVVETIETEIQGLPVTFQKRVTRDIQGGGVSSIGQAKILWTGKVQTLPGLSPMGYTYEACYRDAERQVSDYLQAWHKEQRARSYEEIYTVGEAIYGKLWTALIARVFGISTGMLPDRAWSRAYKRALATCCLGILSHIHSQVKPSRPRVVCLIGSARFGGEFAEASSRETLAGNIVLAPGLDVGMQLAPNVKAQIDELQLQKIEMADEVLILNRDGYVDEATIEGIRHAESLGKILRWLEPENALIL
jgi:hypothetical protein